MPKPRRRYYVGVRPASHPSYPYARVVIWLRGEEIPDPAGNCREFAYVTGPFRTRRGAEFMAGPGAGNPCCQTVADAERLADAAERRGA